MERTLLKNEKGFLMSYIVKILTNKNYNNELVNIYIKNKEIEEFNEKTLTIKIMIIKQISNKIIWKLKIK